MNSHKLDERKLILVRVVRFVWARNRLGSSLLTALFSLVVLLTMAAPSFAQSVLTDDAHTSTAPKSFDVNFGTNPNLNVSSTGNVYIKFKLSSTLPAATPGSAIQRATLKLYLANVTTAGKLDVYAVAGLWDEATITARNAPPLGNLLTTTTQIGLDKRHEFLIIDITPLVQQWLGDDGLGTNGIPNYGIALVAHGADATTPEVASITFDSKENSQTSHEAQLNIHLEKAADGLQTVVHDASLTGDGTSALPLGVANGGITNVHLADNSVTGGKIADNAVTTTELADGSVTSAKITAPLSLTSADPGFTLSVANTGAGPAITTTGAINTSTQYNIGGNRALSVSGNQFFPNSNVFAGVGAGSANTTGGSNSFFGANAGLSNTTGSDNSFYGRDAGKLSIASQFNSFFGNSSGLNNTTGSRNIFAGWGAGLQNTTGGSNSFVGVLAGRSNTTGEHNTHFGNHAGSGYQVGSWNTFIGSESGTPISEPREGNNNTALGYRAWVDDGLSFATAIGSGAVVSTNNTVVLGRSADTVKIPGALNVDGTFGANILNATTQLNLGGNRVLSVSGTQQTPFSNIFAGVGAGASNTSGGGNSFFGHNAGLNNATGDLNSFFGFAAGQDNTTGGGNAFFGPAAGRRNNANFNSFFGAFAGDKNTTGEQNAFFGGLAGIDNTTGGFNSFFGASAGGVTTAGSRNTFVGQFAGGNNTTGNSNSFFGAAAGGLSATGANNTFIGVDTGFNTVNPLGNNNTLLGAAARVGMNNLTHATAIGANAVVTTSNSVVLGRSADTVQIPGALNVAGTFGASIFNAVTQFNIGGQRVLSVTGSQQLPNSNTFAGVGAGALTVPSISGALDGNVNAFFGESTGTANTTGHSNAFFGSSAGLSNTTGNDNALFGRLAGFRNTIGDRNSFFGVLAGEHNTTGHHNSFFGSLTGFQNKTGTYNTSIGSFAGVGNDNLTNATAIGAHAQVSQNNSLVLGSINGINFATSDTNVGIGTTAPQARLEVRNGNILMGSPGQGIILKSPDGATCRLLSIDNAGAMLLAPIACP